MKVNGINNIYFKGSANKLSDSCVQKSDKEIKELAPVTPDFAVKVPQKYKKISVEELPNGLKLHSYKLGNGYRVSIVPMEDSPAVVKTYVNVGSMNETHDIKGISHFLEHMAFNGTNGEDGHIKLETGDSFKKIDSLGGWANASTNYALTDYVNSAPLLNEKDLETQIRVLGAMTEDLKLSEEMIEKEKGPVSSEINMIMDDTQTIAMDQTVRTLFGIKNPADELVGGSVKHIQNLTRKDVMDYYNKYYTPENINIVITGDVNPDEVIRLVSKNFTSTRRAQGQRYDEKLTPIQKTVRKDFVSDKAKSAEIVLGFLGYKNNSAKEKILYRIAENYLNSENVGLSKNLKEFNASYGIGDEKITTKPSGDSLVYVGITSSEDNVEKVLKTVFDTIQNAKPISQPELERIKALLKENRERSFEYSMGVNNTVGNAVLNGTLDDYLRFDEILDNITPQDVDEAIKKYFDLTKSAITVIHPQKSSGISFKGKSRNPVNETKISETTLKNNVNVGFYRDNSPVRSININLETDFPYKGKAGVRDILSEIYSMGTMRLSEDEFNKKNEDLNLVLYTNAGADGMHILLNGNNSNYKEGLKLAKELIYSPRITPETLQKAKDRIKECIQRSELTAGNLYFNEFYSKYDDFAFSDKEILETIDSITIDDVKDFHNYILNNSRGIVSANIPNSPDDNIENDILNFAKNLHRVKPNKIEKRNFYKEVKEPIVLTGVKNSSQADIKQVYNFKYEDSLKNRAVSKIMNSILSSSSIGLFDNLREKEKLAYSVFSDCTTSNDWGEISLNILTTTENKEIGEISYENVQRSIDGFKRQIGELLDSKFTDEDLENAKRSLKANLLNKEGGDKKSFAISEGLTTEYGITYENQLFDVIDSITREDVVEFAKNAFSGKPVYSITATKNTLSANKNYLDNLKNT